MIPTDPTDRTASHEAERLGAALAQIRKTLGLSQAEAGARIGMTSQGWGLYEAGRRPGLFRPDVQRRLTGALDASPEDLALILARSPSSGPVATPADGVASGSRAYRAGPAGPGPAASGPGGRERMQLSTDDLAPWAGSGVTLEYDPGRWPRRDQGCVIGLADGSRQVRIYDHADGEALYLRGGPGGLEVATPLARSDVAWVAAVVARLES
ncbi:MAG: helix-turn-helix transcriptional regulator [Brevundimonas sp.]|uniref:helix-turn-helix transcriptional regulator n=1 Tax=Brevundimonas sp. TaxID=1871086 RepID=UPI0040343D5D